MKYVVVLGDGMADYPLEELGGKTPLQAADKPTMDALAKQSQLGLVQTIPQGMHPGSDTANLAVLGYNPQIYYSGRSPFEAASMGVALLADDVTFRCNLVTLSEEADYEKRVMLDHSADEITSQEAQLLLEEVRRQFQTPELTFYPGVSYRHLMVWRGTTLDWKLTPPHDLLGQPISAYLPAGPQGEKVLAMMEASAGFLGNHPVNQERRRRGLRPANSIWIWGEGKKPQLTPFAQKYGLQGAVISAVDLIKGIGVCAGLKVLEVEGATGTLYTNYEGKASAALAALNLGMDFVYIHIEAPDECGHRQERDNKIKAIEFIDKRLIKHLKAGLDEAGEPYRLLIMPDHATPLILRTHTSDPVPFLIYDSSVPHRTNCLEYSEQAAQDTGLFVGEGYMLMTMFLSPSAGGKV